MVIRTYERHMVVPGAKLNGVYKGARLVCIVTCADVPGAPPSMRRKTRRDDGVRYIVYGELLSSSRPPRCFKSLWQATKYARNGNPADGFNFWTLDAGSRQALERQRLATEYILRVSVT